MLGRCIQALGEKHDKRQIPFRESKLTRILQEYFTDQNNLLMIANVSLNLLNLEENIKVLEYASVARQIRLHNRNDNQPTERNL